MSSTSTQILFIDSRVANIDTLLANVVEGVEVHLINSASHGLLQMAAVLEGRSDVGVVSVIAHGGDGYMALGDGTFDQASLSAYDSAISVMRASLTDGADFLLYGCDVAAGTVGKAFIDALALATGADVAASVDTTGSSLLGGDWVLEAATGAIEGAAPITQEIQDAFDASLGLPGAHSAKVGSEVFLGGNYIELGISSVGSFGTNGSKPANFIGTTRSTKIGMSNDADGFGVGTNLGIDYFLPGSPEERWVVGYNGNQTASASALAGSSGTISITGVTNDSSGDTLKATHTAVANNTLQVQQIISFGVNDKFFKNTVTLTNTTGATLSDVRFMRSFDPDNTVFYGGGYSTFNRVDDQTASTPGGSAVVSATSLNDSYQTAAGSTAKILFYSNESTARVAAFGFSNRNPYAMPSQNTGYSIQTDGGISIMFAVGSLAPGESKTVSYYTSLDTRPVAETVAAIETVAAVPNVAPSFALPTYDGSLSTATDTSGNDTFANLTGHLNASDSDGGTMAYTGSATGVYGRLVVNTNGTFTFFVNNSAVQARTTSTTETFNVSVSDGQGGTTNGTLQFTIAGVNDAPVIANNTTAISMTALAEDPAANAGTTIASLLGPRFTDRDSGSSLGGAIVTSNTASASEGEWQFSTDGGTTWSAIGAVSGSSGLALSAATLVRFSPAADWNGTPSGLTLFATDNLYAGSYSVDSANRVLETNFARSGVSFNSVDVGITVTPVNDGPRFDPATPIAIGLADTDATDTAGTLNLTGSLTGTVSATDPEGSAVTYGIRGGSASSGIWTLQGLYGQLQLDTTVSPVAWTYTPNKLDIINALPAGATVTDKFDLRAVDSSGAYGLRPIVVTITGTNDLPLASATNIDQAFARAGNWVYQVPSSVFSDAEGLSMTYAATLADNSPLPSWLTFDDTTRTFTGNPPKGTADISLKVTATDSEGETVSKTFGLDFTPASLNDAPTGSVTITNDTDAGRGTATLEEGDTLSATDSLADADGPAPLTVTYKWYADGVEVGSGATYTLAQADVGKKITVVGSYTDAGGVIERVSSSATSAVVEVNTAPTVSPGSATGAEDKTLTFKLADFGTYTDDTTSALSSVTISSLPTNGTLKLGGVNVVLGDLPLTLTADQIKNGQLTFVPDANGHNTGAGFATPYATFSYTVSDGVDSSASNTFSLNITPVNDAPTGSVTVTTDGGATAATGDLLTANSTLADADGIGSFTYQWYANGVAIGGANAGTYTLTAGDLNKTITVKVSYTDADGGAESVVSVPFGTYAGEAGNTAPVLTTPNPITLTETDLKAAPQALNFTSTTVNDGSYAVIEVSDADAAAATQFTITVGSTTVTNLDVSTASDGASLATLLQSSIRTATGDSHVSVAFSAGVLKITDTDGRTMTGSALVKPDTTSEIDSSIAIVNVESTATVTSPDLTAFDGYTLSINGVIVHSTLVATFATLEDFRTQLETDINNAGYPEVTVTVVGSDIVITDILGRNISAFTLQNSASGEVTSIAVGRDIDPSIAATPSSVIFDLPNGDADAKLAVLFQIQVGFTIFGRDVSGATSADQLAADLQTQLQMAFDSNITVTFDHTNNQLIVSDASARFYNPMPALRTGLSYINPTSTATINVGTDFVADDASFFSATVGGVTVTSVDVSAAIDLATLAGAMQTALRAADSGNTDISVSVSAGGDLVIVDALHRVISGVSLLSATSSGEIDVSIDYANPSSSVVFDLPNGDTDAQDATSFSITIDGIPVSVDVSAEASASDLATDVQAAIRAAIDADISVIYDSVAKTLTVSDTSGRAITAPHLVKQATVQDIDLDGIVVGGGDNAGFNGGTLHVDFSTGGASTETLSLPASSGNITVVGSDVKYSGTTIGTISAVNNGVAGKALDISFNNVATSAQIQDLIQALKYANSSDTPPASRTINVTLTDAGGLSDSESLVVNITPTNTPPVSTDTTVAAARGVGQVLTLADFGNYFDAEDGPHNYVIIKQLPSLQIDASPTYAAGTPGTSFSTLDFDVTDAQADSAAFFQITLGGGLEVSTKVTGATDGASLAAALEAALRAADGGATDITVTWASDVLTITDESGRAFTNYSLVKPTGTLELDGVDLAGASFTNTSGIGGTSPLPTGVEGYWISIADITAGKLVYTPDASAPPSITGMQFYVEENPISTSSYSITFGLTNTAPTFDGTVTALANGTEDTAYTVTVADLLADYSDADGNTLYAVGLTATHGTVTKNLDGSGNVVSYTIQPDADYNGPMVLSYTVADGFGGTIDATRTVTVDSVNDPLVLVNPVQDRTATAGTAVDFVFNKPFADADNDAITYTILANGQPLSDYGLTLTDLAPGSNQFRIQGNPVGSPSITFSIAAESGTGPTLSNASTAFVLSLQDPTATGGTTGLYGLSSNNIGVVTVTGTTAEDSVLTASRPTDADGLNASTPVRYQWQVSTDGTNWSDIAGARGQATTTAATTTLTLTQDEVGKQVRVQAFYIDDGSVAESPVSSATGTVTNLDDPGALSISGSTAIGSLLTSNLSDPDGLSKMGTTGYAVTYQWHRLNASGDTPSGATAIAGATSSTYTTVDADANKYMKVVVTYTDDWNTSSTLTSSTTLQAGAAYVLPTATNDSTLSLTEAVVPGVTTNGTGVLLGNDTVDVSSTKQVSSVRTGNVEGVGTSADDDGTSLTVTGLYGTLVVNKTTGAYEYTLDNTNYEVNTLTATSTSLSDQFNYTLIDGLGNTDTAVVTITINGANDIPTLTGVAATATVVEDVGTVLPLDGLTFADPDGPNVSLRLTVANGTLRATSFDPGITITGSDTNVLTITGTTGVSVEAWLAANDVQYVTALNANGTVDTLTYAVSDGISAFTDSGTTTITATDVNDAPRVDANGLSGSDVHVSGDGSTLEVTRVQFLPTATATTLVFDGLPALSINAGATALQIAQAFAAHVNGDVSSNWTASVFDDGSVLLTADAVGARSNLNASSFTTDGTTPSAIVLTAAGNDNTVTFKPRGTAVTVAPMLEINDVDSSLFASATMTLATGTRDNNFGVIYETLTATGAVSGITVTGNGSGTDGLTGATSLTFTSTVVGGSSKADFESVMRTVQYNNTNANAFAGDRTVTVSVVDAEGTSSNATTFATAQAEPLVQVGQRIYIDGLDSGAVVSEVRDTMNFVASRALPTLTANSNLAFYDASHLPGAPITVAATGAALTAGATTFTTAADNGSILAGQRIFINGEDTGRKVLTVNSSSSFVADGPLPATAEGANLTFFSPALAQATLNGALSGSTANFAIATGSLDVYPDQKIFINGVDTGRKVLTVTDTSHFVADGVLPATASGAALSFYSATAFLPGQAVATADATGPLVSTITVLVPWTPAVDNNGIQSGTDLYRDYNERSAPVAIATADASITDQDGLIRNLTITLTNPQDNGGGTVYEYLTAPTDATLKWLSVRGITLEGVDGTGGVRTLTDNNGNSFTVTNVIGATQFVFTASGAGTDATNFQVALRGVGYQNMDHDPTTGVQRIVNVTSTDVAGNVGVDATTYINVGAVNSEPAGTDHTAAVNEDNTYTFAAADFGFTDPLDTHDGGPSNNLLAVKLTTLPSASHGVIKLNGSPVAAGTLISVTDINAGNLTFVPAQDYNGNLTGSFTFQVKDDGGVANGGQNLDQSANTYNFNIAPQNDAPVLTADGADFTGITEEDTTNAGQLVSDILGTITDVDDTALAHSANNGKLTGAAIYSLSSGGVAGTWQYKLDADLTNTWVSISSITTGKALLLGSADMLRFVPDAVRGTTTDSLTQPSISYYAWDQAVGTAGTELTISGNQGGTGTLSTVSDTVAIEVSDVNDAPTVTAPGTTVTLNEDNTVGITGVSFGDVDITSANNPNAASQIVEVTLSVSHGTIALATNSGITVTAGADQSASMTITGTLADVNTAVATLTYAPGSNYNGNDTLQIGIDDQGNVGGGALTATGSVAISVTPVNDRPVLTATGSSFTAIDENATNNAGQTVASFMGTFTDVDSGTSAANNGTGTGIAITSASTGDLGGYWEYSTDNGAHWYTITLADGDALPLLSTDKVRYVPDSVGGTDANDLVKPGLSYRVWDTSVGTNGTITTVAALGGSAASSSLSSASDSTVNITVTDVNDVPTIAAPATATVAEDGSIDINGVSFGDLDITGRADGTSSNDNVTVTLSVSHGTITLADTADLTFDGGTSDGSASMTFTGSLSAVNAAVATLTYVPTADFEGSDQLSIHVDDLGNVGGTALTADQTINLTVTGVNDAPVLTAADPTQALPEITEDDTGLGNTGALISALVGAGAGQTGIADADTPNGANGTEAIGQGVAIYSLTVGSNGTGTWQYKLGSGAWQNAGVVDSQNALLLGANDSIRFLPDAENSTTGAIEYRLWDGASGAAGNKVDVTTNGGTTAFSADTDSATITVTDINDAPTVTINGAYANVYFGAMGAAVDVFAPGSVTLGDVDIGDRVTSATVTIDSLYDLDNDFGTTYEYLTTTAVGGEFVINGNTIIITGNGGGADGLTEATELYLDGAASLADYEAALATIQYQNTNPNAYAGPRPILLQITDDGDPDWAATDTASNTETVTVNVNWGPVVDMSGVINADRDLYISYAEDDPAVLISASNAEIKDLDGNIASVTVTLTNPLDNSDESIFISDASALVTAGITATVAPDGHSIVLTPTIAAGLDGTKFQLALRTIKYQNLSQSPTADQRDIEVTSLDVDGNPGLLAHTYINVSGTNDAPVLTAGGPDFNTITEDATSNDGQLVSDILGTTTDVDRAGADGNSSTNGILEGVAIYSFSSGGISGTWQYKLAADVTETWVDITSITSGKALLLGSTDSLRFVPDTYGGTTANTLAKPSISYYAWDQAVGTAGSELAIAANQGQADSTLSTGADTVAIAVTDVNDAPVITAPTSATVAEDGSIGITGVSIADVDVTNRADGDLTNNNVQVTLSVSHGTITLASTAGITVNSGADASATMTITGSLSAVNTAVATLTYAPTADYNGADALTIDVNDLGNVGGVALDATQQTISISVTGVNDAPVLTDGTPALTSIDENATTNTGTLVSALVGAGGTSTGIADADGLTAEGTEAIGKGIAVYGLSYNYNGGPVAGGTWQYQLASGSWTDVGVVDSTHALLLESTSGLRFVPDAENGGTGTVSFYLWDGASGTAGSKVDVTTRGGTTAFSTAGDQATISVADVNDNTVVLTEDLAGAVTELGVSTTSAISDTGTITFSDVDWSGLHSLASSGARVTNTTLTPGGSVLGSLALVINTDTNGGTTGDLSWTYSVADNLVEYLKAGETKVEEFTINLYDDQGATTTRTVAVTITGTNDAPVIGANIATGAVTELVTPTGNLSTGDTVIGFTDVDLADTHTITSTSPITGQGVVHGSVTASVTTDTTGSGTGGEITWNYTVAASAVEYLSAGETKVEQFDIVLDDNNDGLDLQARRVSVTLTGTNDAPTDITVDGSDTLSLDEIPGAINFLSTNTTVAHFSTTDVDHLDTHTYTIVGGADAQFFQIVNGNELQLRQLTPLDAEVKREFVVTVRTNDGQGGTFDKSFTITINDLNEVGVVARNWLVQPQTFTVNGTPTAFAANSLPEHDYTGLGIDIGVTAVAEDADATTNVVTYALVSDATGNAAYVGRNGNVNDVEFSINANTGRIDAIGNLDYETEGGLRTLYVKATSQDGSSVVSSITLNIANVDEVAPTFNNGSTATATTLVENSGAGQVVYTAQATDTDFNAPNTATSLVYTLDQVGDYQLFQINQTTGAVTLIGNPDYETKQSYSFTVRVRDADGNYTTQAVSLAVSNLNDNPVTAVSDSNVATNTVAENAAVGTVVGLTASANDADIGAVVTYSLSNDAGGKFAINSTTGVVTVAGALDYETATSHDITVVASSSDGSASTSQTYTIAVTNVNDNTLTAVSDTDTAANSLAENAAIGAAVGITAHASDADTGAVVTYSLTDDAGGKFSINATTGVVTLASALDFETAQSHTITVQATSSDGSPSTSQTFTIAVTNVNDNPVTAITDTNADTEVLAEDAAIGSLAGITAHASDADTGAVVTYSLSDNAGGKFAINSTTGVVTLASALDYETATSHTITVVATSSDGSTPTSQNYTITVTNVSDNGVVGPADTNVATNNVDENVSVGTVVSGLTIAASDADTGTTIAYSLTNDAGGKFAIDATTGVVTVAGALDYETAASHTITVRALSSDGSVNSQDFTINVNNLNDNAVTAVSDSNGATNTVAENAAVGAVVGLTALASDADTGAVVTYSLSDNAGGKFAINSSTGVVTVASALDYETATSHNITVVASSSDGSASTSQTFTIAVTNVNDNALTAVSDTDTAANSLAENAAIGAAVGITAHASDADTGAVVTYSLTNNAGGKFAIDASTGVVTLASALDFETAQSHTITVQATSSDGSPSTSQNFTIGVTNVNDNPVVGPADTNNATNNVNENVAVGTVVSGLSITASDADQGGRAITYSLTNDAGGKFAINASTGVVTVAGAINYELAASHVITVQALSEDGSVATQDFTILVNNQNDAPTGTPYIAGTPLQGSTLTIERNDLADEDIIDTSTFSYKWYANGVEIANENSAAITLKQDQVGKTITAAISYRDNAGYTNTTAQTAATGVVVDLNDAPLAVASTVSATEDVAKILPAASFGFSDAVDAGGLGTADTLQNVRIESLPATGTGVLTLNGVPVTVGQVIAASALVNTNAGLVFTPAANVNGPVSFTFSVQDNGGTANAGADWSTSAATMTLNIAAVNDAPVLTVTAPAMAGVNEDAGVPSGAVGTLVSALVSGVSDLDAAALKGVAITAANSANGSYYYSLNNGTSWTAFPAVSSAASLLLAADSNTRVYFKPTANFNGTVSDALTFRAWDQSTGTAGTTANTTTNGSTTAFSSATDTVSVAVAAVNDAPTVSSELVAQTATQDVSFSYTFGAGSFADVDTGDALTYSASLANGGSLPSWLVFNPATRTFSGTPTNGDVGTITVDRKSVV